MGRWVRAGPTGGRQAVQSAESVGCVSAVEDMCMNECVLLLEVVVPLLVEDGQALHEDGDLGKAANHPR